MAPRRRANDASSTATCDRCAVARAQRWAANALAFNGIGTPLSAEVGADELFVDLLMYHARLTCHEVVKRKVIVFKQEHAGRLNFYLSVIDAEVTAGDGRPTMGLLLSWSQNRGVGKHARSGIDKPIAVAEYQLVRALTEPLDTRAPSIEQIEPELLRALGEDVI